MEVLYSSITQYCEIKVNIKSYSARGKKKTKCNLFLPGMDAAQFISRLLRRPSKEFVGTGTERI